MTIRLYEHGSPDYESALDLRRRVLREPLGLSFSEADIEAERDQVHIGGFEGETAVATLSLRLDGATAVMRQVAVDDGRQGQGIGRKIVEACEKWARDNGYAEVRLHARLTAVPFYERLGYRTEGEVFEEVTIPHIEMAKSLA